MVDAALYFFVVLLIAYLGPFAFVWLGLQLEWTAERQLVVPYDVIHADFDLRAVA